MIAYPQDRIEIEKAWAMLNDADEVLLPELNFPGGTPSGDVLDGLLSMTDENWQERCEELAEVLRAVVAG